MSCQTRRAFLPFAASVLGMGAVLLLATPLPPTRAIPPALSPMEPAPMSDSPSTARLLEVAEDKSRDVNDRIAALIELKGRRDVPIERVVALLDSDKDLVVLAAVGVLSKLGDPKALPALEKKLEQEQQSRDICGVIRGSLWKAIESCKPKK